MINTGKTGSQTYVEGGRGESTTSNVGHFDGF